MIVKYAHELWALWLCKNILRGQCPINGPLQEHLTENSANLFLSDSTGDGYVDFKVLEDAGEENPILIDDTVWIFYFLPYFLTFIRISFF